MVSKRNFRVGDIVFLKEVYKNKWKLPKVIEVYNDEKGHNYIGASGPDQLLSCVFVPSINKILLLVEMNDVQSPTEES